METSSLEKAPELSSVTMPPKQTATKDLDSLNLPDAVLIMNLDELRKLFGDKIKLYSNNCHSYSGGGPHRVCCDF